MKTLFLIGAADSIGVPYTRDNLAHEGFFELFTKFLSQDYDVATLNCFHMSTNNDNRYIMKLLTSDMTLADVKTSQNEMLQKCKYSGIYPFIELPKSFLNYYRIYDGDEHLIIRDCLKENNSIFIYSAFVNDLLKSQGISLFQLLKPGKIKKVLRDLNLNLASRDLRRNLEALIGLNPDIKIFLIGWFVPTKISYVRKNLREFVVTVNADFARVAQEYPNNVFFVDNMNLTSEDFSNIDFHPNKFGHKKIYRNLVVEYEKLNNIE